jgi:hypothetical protein
MVENELKGSAFYLGEVCTDCGSDIEELEQDRFFQANVAFLMSQKFSLKIMRRILLSRKIPTAILSFDTPTAPDEMLSPLSGQTHSNFIDRFKAEVASLVLKNRVFANILSPETVYLAVELSWFGDECSRKNRSGAATRPYEPGTSDPADRLDSRFDFG